jgi:3-oxoacyl-(acyl-carrier-protein) synthase
MSRRRVVVTGLGCVSPVGNTVDEAWANLLAGQSGIGLITKFDASAFSCKIAGEVRNLDLDSYISPKDARAMDSSFITASLRRCKRSPTRVYLQALHLAKNKPRESDVLLVRA